MSDRDTDPMDRTYAQAEALLDDDAVRAARRARILAAVAVTTSDAETAPARPRSGWRHSGWLVAAGVAGVSLFIAIQINPPPVMERPTAPPAPAMPPAAEPPPASPPLADAPREPTAIAPPERLVSPAPADAASAEIVVEAAKRSPTIQDAPVAAPRFEPAPLPAPPPPPPPPSSATARAPAPVMGRLARPPAPPRAQTPAPSSSGLEEIVVTGERRESGASPEALAQRLRDAAAAGQSREISVLLAREVPIDATDDQGETALMKAVQARQLDTAALLRRRGASLDLKNSEGRSVRDMAAALADPEMNKALGLGR